VSGKTAAPPEIDFKLSKRDLKLIRLTDGGGKGSRLEFSAGDGKILSDDWWPAALRNDECKKARENFARARDAVIKESSTGKISHAAGSSLMQAISALIEALEAAYPADVRNDQHQAECMAFLDGQRYLKNMTAVAHRAINVGDASVFKADLRFQGDSLFGLIQHMYRNGLQFAPPGPGGDGVYNTLFENLRQMYIQIGQDRPSAAPEPQKASEAKPAADANERHLKQDDQEKDQAT
jgi:hypothetical protein